MTIIAYIFLVGVLLSTAYYNRKVDLKRIEQINFQNEQQAEVTRKFLEELERGVLVYNKGKFVIYRADEDDK